MARCGRRGDRRMDDAQQYAIDGGVNDKTSDDRES